MIWMILMVWMVSKNERSDYNVSRIWSCIALHFVQERASAFVWDSNSACELIYCHFVVVVVVVLLLFLLFLCHECFIWFFSLLISYPYISPLYFFGGVFFYSVIKDFAETPSHLMEYFALDYNSLRHFAKHHKTHEVLYLFMLSFSFGSYQWMN